jgi:hypothetical protein
MSGVLWLFDGQRLAQIGQHPPLAPPRCGLVPWPESGEDAAAFIAEGACPICCCGLNPDLIAWFPLQDELEVCIPYMEEQRSGWLGHRCDCCITGWALVLKPRGTEGPAVVGILPWGRWGPYEFSVGCLHGQHK